MNYTLFLTGLSGAGKSTLAEMLKKNFPDLILLDGDIIRQGLCSDLKFSIEDRTENIRRISELCKLFNDNGKNVVTAFISPIESDSILAKKVIKNCHIIYINSSFETCKERDTKGLYKKAIAGEIPNFTGVSSPYEKPVNPDLVIDTENRSIEDSYQSLIYYYDKVKKQRTACIDFDGVINNYTGYKGIGVFEEPVPGAIENINKLKEAGWKIIIHTTRGETHLIKDYCEKYNIPVDEYNTNSNNYPHQNQGKPYADIYIDDRAVNFNGNWSETFDKAINFKTWTGR